MFYLSHPILFFTLTTLLLLNTQVLLANPVTAIVSPQTLVSGKTQSVTVTMPGNTPIEQLYLSPGGPAIKQSWSLPHPGQDLVWHDNLVYIAAGAGGMIIIDRNNSDNPVQSRLSVGDAIHQISISNQHAWLAAQGGLYTVDIRDPDSPRTRAFTNTANAVTALASDEQYTALAQGHEIQLFDSRRPGQLKTLVTLPLDHDIHAIAIDRQQLFIAAGKQGVLRYQITNDHQLLPAGRYRTTGPAIDIQVSNGIASVATQDQGLTLLDVSDTQQLQWLGSHQQAGQVRQLVKDTDRNQVMLHNERQQLLLMDISNPRMPSMLSSLQLKGKGAALYLHDNSAMILIDEQLQQLDFTASPAQYSNEGLDFGQGVNYGGERRIFIRDNIAYVADWFSGIHLYDISTPSQPRLLSSFHTEGSPKGIVVRDDYAYVADDDHGLQVININNPRKPFKVAELATPGLAYIPVLDNDRLYLAGHRGGFQIIDIENPEKPALLGNYDTAGKTWGIRIRDNIAYIADDNSGLMMFDVSQPGNIQLIGQFSPGGDAEDVILHGNIAYVVFFDRGLYIIDISDPGYPKKLGHIQTPGNARGIARDGNTLYIADWLSGIQVIDVSIPSRPRLIGSYDTAGAAWGLALQNKFAFVMDWWGGFSVLDITQATAPTLAGRYHHRDHIQDISIQDNVAYAASGKGGLQIYDIKNPLNPTWMTGIDFDTSATHVVSNAQRAYVALADRHIAIIDTSDPFSAYSLRQIRSPYPIVDLHIQGSWLTISHANKGMTLYRIDGKYADKPKKKLRIKDNITSAAFFDNQSIAIAQTNGIIKIYNHMGDKKSQYEFNHNATLLRSYKEHLISYYHENGINILDRNGNIISSISTEQTVLDIQVRNNTLYLINDQQQLVAIEMSAIKQPIIKARYQTLSPSTRITTSYDALYLSGNISITAIRQLPDTSWTEDTRNDNAYTLSIPDTMPTGSYNLHSNRLRTNNVITIELPKFTKPKFSMKDLNKALEKMRSQGAQH